MIFSLLPYREGRHDVFYYSTQKHLDELTKALRSQEEYVLLNAIDERYDEIVKHMKITDELYKEKKGMTCTRLKIVVAHCV